MANLATEREPIAATEAEQPQIQALRRLLETGGEGASVIFGREGNRIALPESLRRVLRRAVDALAREDAVAVVPVHKLLTTTETADLLKVSRPYLIRLLDRGDVPCTMVGSHRRIAVVDVLAYQQSRDTKRREALRELTRMNQEFGLYERH